MQTLVSLLCSRAAEDAEREAFTFSHGGAIAERLTYRELDARARQAAHAIRRRCAPGEPLLLMHPPGLDFVADFFGCAYAGAVAVPTPAPANPRELRRLRAIVASSRARLALTNDAGRAALLRRFDPATELDGVEVAVAGGSDRCEAPAAARADDLAVLQFTSGSTSEPRGVMLTHANVMSNLAEIHAAFALRSGDEGEAIALWLPHFHDMGLFARLSAVYAGAPCHLMAPLDFARRPYRWLELIARCRATVSGGPNFAFDACAERVPDADRAALDLSSLRVLFCGAEPVRGATLERFADRFAACGFDRHALLPCYGLAEVTLLAASRRRDRPLRALDLDAEALARGEVRGGGVRRVVSCGPVCAGLDAAVVDPATCAELPPGRLGELWLRGASVAQGYFHEPAATAQTFRARLADRSASPAYLRTGDLAFVDGGELFVTGRRKAMIVVHGRNVFLQDLEYEAGRCHPALNGKAAAFTAGDRAEPLVLACEVARGRREQPQTLADALERVRATAAAELASDPAEIVLIAAGGIVETSSGKVVRSACRDAWRAGRFEVLARWTPSARRDADDGGERAPIEATLTAMACELLGVHSIGRDEWFFAAGGNSVAASRLLARIEEHYGIELEAERAYEDLTIASVARLVDERLVALVDAMSDDQAAALLSEAP